jgi:peptide-methionine (S)-S-oxide reductase
MARRGVCFLVVVGVAPGFLLAPTAKPSGGGPVPAPVTDDVLASKPAKVKAVFAGGCFWGTQAVFERLKGVVDTTVGYSGGSPQRQPTTR